MKDVFNKILISLFLILITSVISCNNGEESPKPELTLNPITIIEGNTGITSAQITVTSSIPLGSTLEIGFYSEDGTAKSEKDYQAVTSGKVVIPEGSSSGTANIEILTDEVMEFMEDFTLNFAVDPDYQLNTEKIKIFIEDDDDESYEIEKDSEGFITPITYPEMQLAWSDEFNGPSVNTGDWTFELGNGCPSVCGWGNNELQSYTDKEENATIVDGKLIITALNPGNADNYTSARMITKDKQEFEYGRIDIRAKLPEGQGIWPAIWMLGDNIDAVGWPSCGEIDIMELIGNLPQTSHGTAHYNSNGHTYKGSSYVNSNKFSEEFHVFSIFWEKDIIRWYVDYNKFFEITAEDAGGSYPFNHPFFFILNIAVGGNWPGDPDETTVFPQEMHIDYVRVFQPEE